MKKRALSLLLLVALVITALPLIALPIAAAEPASPLEVYNSLYVQEGYQYGIDFFPLNEHWEGYFDATAYPTFDAAVISREAWSRQEKVWLDQFAFHAEGNTTHMYTNSMAASAYTVGAGFLTIRQDDDIGVVFENFPAAPRATADATTAITHQLLLKHNTLLNQRSFALSGVVLPFSSNGTQYSFNDTYRIHMGGYKVADGTLSMEPISKGNNGTYSSIASMKVPFELTTVMTDTVNDAACSPSDKTALAKQDTIRNYTPQDGMLTEYGVFGAGGLPFDNSKMVIGKWVNGTSTRGMDSHVYAYRYYDRALTAAEMKQNHLADLAKWFRVDTTYLSMLTADQLAYLAADAAIVACGFETETVGDTGMTPREYIEDKAKGLASLELYNRFYVQDGYQYGIDFFALNANWEGYTAFSTYPTYSNDTAAWSALEKAWLDQFAFHAEGNETHLYSYGKRAQNYTVGAGFLTLTTSDDLVLMFEGFPAAPRATSDATAAVSHQMLIKHNTTLNNWGFALSGVTLPFSCNGTQYTFGADYKVHNGGYKVADTALSMEPISRGNNGTYSSIASMKVPFELTTVMTDTVNDAACSPSDKTALAKQDTIRNYTPQDGMLTEYGVFGAGGLPFDNAKMVIGKWTNGTSTRGMDSHLYAYRYYDRALTVAEMKQNHLADLIKWFRMDIELMSALSDAELAEIAADPLVVACGFETETMGETGKSPKAYIEAKAAAYLAKAEAKAYNALYVQDGYQYGIDFFVLNANWADFVPTDFPVYTSGQQAAWSALEKAWLDQFAFHAEGNETKILSFEKDYEAYTVGAGFLTIRNTDGMALVFESFPAAPRATDSATAGMSYQMLLGWPSENALWGQRSFAFGGISVPLSSDGTNVSPSDKNLRCGWTAADGANPSEPYRYSSDYYHSVSMKTPFELTTILKDTVNDTASTNREVYKTHDAITHHTPQDGQFSEYFSSGDGGFPMNNETNVIGRWQDYKTSSQAMRMKLYAFRYYDRMLSADEMKQNHLADLAKWFRADIDLLTALTDEQFAQLAADALVINVGFETLTVGDTGMTPKAYIEDKAAEMVAANEAAAPALTFAGYQVRIDTGYASNTYAGVRAVFDIDTALVAELLETEEEVLLSVDIKLDGEARVRLTILYTQAGGTTPVSVTKTVLSTGATTAYSADNIIERENEAGETVTSFVYAVTYQGAAATKENYETEFSYAYSVATGSGLTTAAASYAGHTLSEVVSGTFGETVSAKELYTYFANLPEFAADALVTGVVAACQ